jgi:RNA polymerase sigma-70 factor, ECF subfamily
MAADPPVSPHAAPDSDRFAVFTRMVVERRAYFLRVAQRISLSQQDAEDIVQESVLRAFDNLASFRGDARMDTWVHTIVVNTARNWLRNRGNRVFVPFESEGPGDGRQTRLDLPHPGKSPEESCSDLHLRRLLLAEIRSLEPMYRSPILACDLEECSYREAAATLNLNLCTLKARLFRGRATLKRRLRRLERQRKRSA